MTNPATLPGPPTVVLLDRIRAAATAARSRTDVLATRSTFLVAGGRVDELFREDLDELAAGLEALLLLDEIRELVVDGESVANLGARVDAILDASGYPTPVSS